MAKKTMEQALKDGDFIEIDGYRTRKAGIQVRVVLPAADFTEFGIQAKTGEKRNKELKTLLNAVAWTVHRCQVNKVAANVIVALDAAGFPKLALGVTPLSEADMTPVVVLSRRSEVTK